MVVGVELLEQPATTEARPRPGWPPAQAVRRRERMGRRAARGGIVAASVGNGPKVGVNAACRPYWPMERPGEVIASGRDTEIVDHGPGLVLRRPRDPRSLAGEAAVMEWVRAPGLPLPGRWSRWSTTGWSWSASRASRCSTNRCSTPGGCAAMPPSWPICTAGCTAWCVPVELRGPAATSPTGPARAPLHLDLHPGNVMLDPRRAGGDRLEQRRGRPRPAPTWPRPGC